MNNCIFCQIIAGKIKTEFVYQDDKIVVFKDINPKAQLHFLIVPREHIQSIQTAKEGSQLLLGGLLLVARKIAAKFAVLEEGFKLVINNGKNSGQIVLHLHIHFLAKLPKKSHWDV